MRNTKVFHSVHPRYSCGSPAQVPAETATRVLAQEREAHRHHLAGAYGVEAQRAAEARGLEGVVVSWWENRRRIYVLDHATEERHAFAAPEWRAWMQAARVPLLAPAIGGAS